VEQERSAIPQRFEVHAGSGGKSQDDLFARIPWGDGQTILREALLLADHNAYHLGQRVDLRRLLGEWKG
jgi:hypothetical protein